MYIYVQTIDYTEVVYQYIKCSVKFPLKILEKPMKQAHHHTKRD